MEARYVTVPGTPGRANEDYVLCGPDWIAVLDGATAAPGVDSGCVHDVRWLVRRVAAAVAARMPLAGMPLDDLLAAAITEVRGLHGPDCDLGNPDSPSTTVSLCRVTGRMLEYLVLADSPAALRDPCGSVRVFADDRIEHLPGPRPYPRELVRRKRNQPGGFWVASTNPDAAYHAVRGTAEVVPGSELAVFTDGASRITDIYGQSWESTFGMLREKGPQALITAVRELEAENPPPYGKAHDDATAVHAESLTEW